MRDTTPPAGTRWRVERRSGWLVPGFSKRFHADAAGCTYLFGIPVGRFLVIEGVDDRIELRYRRWPITDRLHADGAGFHGEGYLGRPGRRRFCRFRLLPM